MSVAIEAERAGDADAIGRVVEAAFGVGGRDPSGEVRLVELLRESEAWAPELSLVARVGELVIGYLLMTVAAVERDDGGEVEILSLAPVAVMPGFEATHAGTKLMRAGIERARKMGFAGVVVLGHPKYYRRFGFRQALPMGIRYPGAVPAAAWMALALQPGALDGTRGTVRYPGAFGAVA